MAHTYAVYVGPTKVLETSSWADASTLIHHLDVGPSPWVGTVALRLDGAEMSARFIVDLRYRTEELSGVREPTEEDIAWARHPEESPQRARAVSIGLRVARQVFTDRGNPVSVTLTELATAIAVGAELAMEES